MANNIVIRITTNDQAMLLDTTEPRGAAEKVANFLNACAGGFSMGSSMDIQTNGGSGAYASGTLTLAAVVATDTAAVGGQTFTASATPTGNNQFAVGASDTATAVNLAAAISAHPSLARMCSATSSGAVVTVKCYHVGAIGNYVPLAGNIHITASGADLAGGSDPSAKVYHYGL